MVSFQCEGCGDTLTKKKLDSHYQRCYSAFTCIDCMTTFDGKAYKSHTSCISEAQKYQGALYKEPKKAKTSTPHTPMIPRTPYVEDASSPDLHFGADSRLARLDVPPHAPSPPSAAPPEPVNVFDFLVPDGASQTATPTSSSFMSPKRAKPQSVASSPYVFGQDPSEPRPQPHPDSGISYGDGPVERAAQRFDSELDYNMQIDSDLGPSHDENGHRTPAPTKATAHGPSKPAHESKSDKKRKRSTAAEDVQMTTAQRKADKNQPVLHSGLTGGLAKLLGARTDARRAEASPLNPKKHKKSALAEPEREKRRHKDSEAQHRKRHRRHDAADPIEEEDEDEDDDDDDNEDDDDDDNEDDDNDNEESSAPPQKAIDYPTTALARHPTRRLEQSNSEFFLSLIDKEHTSHKGQSIWGSLKTFREGLQLPAGCDEDVVLRDEERRLFRGLRMKLNRAGEVVLFSLPERERSVSPVRRRRVKMIEAG